MGMIMDWFVNNETIPEGQRTTFCTVSFYNADDPLIPSGLMGPVSINSIRMNNYEDIKK